MSEKYYKEEFNIPEEEIMSEEEKKKREEEAAELLSSEQSESYGQEELESKKGVWKMEGLKDLRSKIEGGLSYEEAEELFRGRKVERLFTNEANKRKENLINEAQERIESAADSVGATEEEKNEFLKEAEQGLQEKSGKFKSLVDGVIGKISNLFSKKEKKEKKEEGFEVGRKSITSEKRPERNEDATLADEEQGLFGVFDGVGGRAAGGEASRIAREQIRDSFKRLDPGAAIEDCKETMASALREASKKISEETRNHPEKKGMGTTASVIKFIEGEGGIKQAIIGNAGDSRVYIERGGKLEQITIDDNLINMHVREGIISEEEGKRMQKKMDNLVDDDELVGKERAYYKNRNVITNAVLARGVEPRIYSIDIKEGDRFIAVSDGVSDNLTLMEIENILKKSKSSEEAADKLTSMSLERSRDEKHPRRKKDDISAVVVRI